MARNFTVKVTRQRRVSSPLATGNSGTFFEQHVDAAYLAFLLVGAIPPVLTDCRLVEASLQAEHLGWHTDDLVLVGETAEGLQTHFAGQVKRAFTASEKDEECVKVFQSFWADFNNDVLFVPGRDELGLVLLGGSNSAANLRSLCDCSRASKDAADFQHRLRVDGFVNASVKKAFKDISSILLAASDGVPDDSTLWEFFGSIHVLALDLNTTSGQTEVQIKSLLALSAKGPNGVGEASVTWLELLEIVGKGMPLAKTFTRDTLPEEMRRRHQLIPTSAADALLKAREHSNVTLRGIRTAINGNVVLDRAAAVSSLLQDVATFPLVLVAGAAGSGKSALAKLLLGTFASDSIVLAFRAEEFKVAHLDQALHLAQIPANAVTLFSLLAGQGRKAMLIDSVERLLEASSRDAFLDILIQCAADPSWHLILTCRDYSIDVVRSSFLDSIGAKTTVFEVPPLSDAEIDEVVWRTPEIARPASHPFLKELFRVPYILDKATRMAWPSGGSLPDDEQAFRRKFWKEIVRREDVQEHALPRRRQQTFMDLCVQRAKALEPFACCADLDSEAIAGLASDSLIEFSPASESLAAPSHDVLEDWAVIEWMAERFATTGSDTTAFVAALGPYPAIRRAFRKWLDELVVSDEAKADAFILGVIGDASVPAYFRDDTLVAVLKSRYGGRFLERNRSVLLSDGAAVLRRVIHLIRVACMTTPAWAHRTLIPLWFVPDGPAWAATLTIIRQELSLFVPKETNLVVGLLADWANGISWWAPSPEGCGDAARIAFALIPHADRHGSKDLLHEILKVILKVPQGGPEAFDKLVSRAAAKDGEKDWVAEQFAELMVGGMDGSLTCVLRPDAVIQVAEACFVNPRPGRDRSGLSSIEVSSSFGIHREWDHSFFPASSLQGPFGSLLKHHPVDAVKFIIRLMNHASNSLADRKVNRELEGTTTVTLKLPDGNEKGYICNGRLWNLYRGTSVGPDVLVSALMALEKTLLEFAANDTENLELLLAYILHASNNVALVSVLASVAIAYPVQAGAVAVSLLTSRELFSLDIGRRVNDLGTHFRLPTLSRKTKMMDEERSASHELPHRKHDLEMLALRLQLTDRKAEVHAILDKFQAELPAVAEQNGEHKLWRIALHRMDLRKFQVRVPTPDETAQIKSTSDGAEEKSYVMAVPPPLEADLQAVVDERDPGQEHFSTVTSLFMFWEKAFEGRGGDEANKWQGMLQRAMDQPAVAGADDLTNRWSVDGPMFAAAACVRDHWSELIPEEQKWCIGRLIAAVRRDVEPTDFAEQWAETSFAASGPAASILPKLLTFELGEEEDQDVFDALFLAVTHSISKVAVHAASGVSMYLGDREPKTVLGFAGLLVRQANRLSNLYEIEQAKVYIDRAGAALLRRQVQREVRSSEEPLRPVTAEELSSVGLMRWPGSDACRALMAMFVSRPEEPMAKRLFRRIAELLSSEWGKDRHRDYDSRRDYRFEGECEDYLAEFALKLSAVDALDVLSPVLAAVQTAPKETASFLKSLMHVCDRNESAGCFWEVWKEFGEHVLKAAWIVRLEDRYPRDEGLLRAVFLGLTWKDGITHWRHLDGKIQLVNGLFEQLPPVGEVFAAYTSMLYYIGQRFFPAAYIILDTRLRAGKASMVLTDRNTVFCLETVLRRGVYGRPDALKGDAKVRAAVLSLLDLLVEAGSSTAYRMRDDFVTPGSVSPQRQIA